MTTDQALSYRDQIAGLILAGGKSRRMGTDKVFLDVGGMTMIERAVKLLEPYVSQVVIVTNQQERMSELGMDPEFVTIVSDAYPHMGPLGGLATGAKYITKPWAVARAVDMPWLSDDLVEFLWENRGGYDAVIPITGRGIEPLCTLYRTEEITRWAQPVLDSGRRRVISFYKHISINEIQTGKIHEFDPYEISFLNINHPGQYRLVAAELEDGWRTMPADQKAFAKAISEAEQDNHQGGYTPIISTKKPRVTDLSEKGLAYQTPRPDSRGRPIKVLHNKPGASGVPEERSIQIMLNDIEIATVQATSRNLDDMAVGFLVSEGLLTDRDAFKGVEVDRKHGVAYVYSSEEVSETVLFDSGTKYITSGCGKGVTFSNPNDIKGLPKAEMLEVYEPDDLNQWITQMSQQSLRYKDTGGSHSCGIVKDGQLIFVQEDVGRHNAADKVIGRAWLNRVDLSRAILLSTGRLSYEIVSKAARHAIPLVASRSAATDLAVSIAEEQNITLAGYVKPGQISIFSHPERIVGGLLAFEKSDENS